MYRRLAARDSRDVKIIAQLPSALAKLVGVEASCLQQEDADGIRQIARGYAFADHIRGGGAQPGADGARRFNRERSRVDRRPDIREPGLAGGDRVGGDSAAGCDGVVHHRSDLNESYGIPSGGPGRVLHERFSRAETFTLGESAVAEIAPRAVTYLARDERCASIEGAPSFGQGSLCSEKFVVGYRLDRVEIGRERTRSRQHGIK
jgi:hypothetical protein